MVTRSSNKQYLVRGEKYYDQHCANCHGHEGEGLKSLIPPLTDPVWIKNDSVVCIIKNGLDGEIQVGEKTYSGRMPGNPELENDEIADLLSYIYHSILKEERKISIKEVHQMELKCK